MKNSKSSGNLFNFFCMYNVKVWKENKVQIFLNIITISIAIALVAAIQLLGLYNTKNISENVKMINGGDVSILYNNSSETKEQSDYLKLKEESNEIEKTSSYFFKTNISFNGKSSFIVLRFIDNSYPLYKDNYKNSPYNIKLENNSSVVLSENIATRLNIKVGDQIKILNKTTGNSEQFRVSEIVSTDGESTLDMNVFGYAYLSKNFLRQYQDDDVVLTSKLYIKVNNLNEYDNIVNEIKVLFKNNEIKTFTEMFEELQNQIQSTKESLSAVGMITFIIAGIGLINIFIMSILKRKYELSILIILGIKNYQLKIITIMESIILTLLSCLIGVPTGFVLSSAINKFLYGSWIKFSTINNVIGSIIIIIGLSIGLSCIFTIIPITLIGKIKPANILRNNISGRKSKTNLLDSILIITIVVGCIFSIYLKSLLGLLYSFLIAITCGGLFGILVLILRCLSRFKNVENPDVIFAIKDLVSQSKRMAMVLMILIIGLTSIGITFNINNNVIPSLKKVVQSQNGYNVLISTSADNYEKVNECINKNKNNIKEYTYSKKVDTSLVEINGINTEKKYKEQLANPTYSKKISQLSVDVVSLKGSEFSPIMLEGRYLTSNDEKLSNAVISFELAKSLDIKLNDEISISINNNYINLKVVGIKNKTLINTSQIVTTFNNLPSNINLKSVIYYINSKNPNEYINYLNKNINDAFILNLEDLLPALNKTIEKQLTLFSFISSLCIIAAVLLMINTLTITFLNRKKEFLIIKIMGGTNKNLKAILRVECLIIGIIGTIVSIINTNIISFGFFKLLLKTDYILNNYISIEIFIIAMLVILMPLLIIIPKIKIKEMSSILRIE